MLLLKRLADHRGMTRPVDGPAPVVIDNRALDGFIERFREAGCRDVDCSNCGWCHKSAAKAVQFRGDSREKSLQAYDELFDVMHDGRMWRFGAGRRPRTGEGSEKRACLVESRGAHAA
jgi:Zn ribbon nucleic-acid-binding protein